MLIVGRVVVDVRDLLVDVPFHAAAQRRIELRQITELHAWFVISSESREIPYSLILCSRGSLGRLIDCLDSAQHDRNQVVNQGSSSLKYFSASMAAAQPDPAAVTACL